MAQPLNTQLGSVELVPQQGAITRVTAGGPAPGQTLKAFSGKATLSAAALNVALETVTAGKTLIITDVVITTSSTAQHPVRITAGGSQIFAGHVVNTKGLEAPGIESQPQGAAGQAIVLDSDAATLTGTVYYNILGVEQ